MVTPLVEAFFLPRDEHSLFCLLFSPPPDQPTLGAVLHVPAFAEEMNKARRAVANTARAIAAKGWQVMVLDLHGTGDSSGELEDASWQGWLADIEAATALLRKRFGTEPILWGLRVGCLLIDHALERGSAKNLLFWQPSLSGDAALTQFLRLKSIGATAGAKSQGDTVKGMLADLEAGAIVEVAGYRLPPAVALPMRQARIGIRSAGKRITWLETSTAEPPECMPASITRIAELKAAGHRISSAAVAGPAFWMTQEIDEAWPLAAATLDSLADPA